MNRSLLFLSFLLVGVAGFSQQFGTLLVEDYDDPLVSVEGVSVWYGKELLGKTDYVGSFHFPRKLKGTITLSHPDYRSRELNVKTKEGLVIDTNLIANDIVYDSLKMASMPIVYRQCLFDDVRPMQLNNTTTAVSLKAFNEYVTSAMHYPRRARDARVEGTVQLRFRISAEGRADCVEVVKGASFELDKEALRILTGMPQWLPARKNGVAVPAVYAVEIIFKL